jgi:hypothetical protein
MKFFIAFFLAVVLGIALGVATASLRLALTPWNGNPPVVGDATTLKSPS